MDTLSAYAMGQAHRNDRSRVFDWDRAAQLIKERNPECVSAGLGGDWERTGGDIYKDGKTIEKENTYTYLASTWAAPEIEIDGEIMDCGAWEDETLWNAKTYWPESALKILKG